MFSKISIHYLLIIYHHRVHVHCLIIKHDSVDFLFILAESVYFHIIIQNRVNVSIIIDDHIHFLTILYDRLCIQFLFIVLES